MKENSFQWKRLRVSGRRLKAETGRLTWDCVDQNITLLCSTALVRLDEPLQFGTNLLVDRRRADLQFATVRFRSRRLYMSRSV
jgi:hypothetical protein